MTDAAPRFPLSGACIAVLGASGGLGRAIAGGLASRGSNLLLAGRHPHRVRAVALAGARIALADIRDPACGRLISEAATEAFGGPDGLVNGAWDVAFGPLADHNDDAIEELFLPNVMGPLRLLRDVLPLLQSRQGLHKLEHDTGAWLADVLTHLRSATPRSRGSSPTPGPSPRIGRTGSSPRRSAIADPVILARALLTGDSTANATAPRRAPRHCAARPPRAH